MINVQRELTPLQSDFDIAQRQFKFPSCSMELLAQVKATIIPQKHIWVRNRPELQFYWE